MPKPKGGRESESLQGTATDVGGDSKPEEKQRRCWGRSKLCRRCGRYQEGRFCVDHRMQPLWLAVVAVPSVLAGWVTLYAHFLEPDVITRDQLEEVAKAFLETHVADSKSAEVTSHRARLLQVIEAAVQLADAAGVKPNVLLEELNKGETGTSEGVLLEYKDTAMRRGGEWLRAAGTAAVRLGDLFYFSDFQKAESYYEEATQLSPSEAHSWKQLGTLRLKQGEYEEARTALYAGLAAAGSGGATDTRCRILVNVAVAELHLGNLEPARERAIESVDCSAGLGSLDVAALAKSNLATLEMLEGNSKEAAELAGAAMKDARASKSRKAEASSMHILGVLAIGRSQYTEAERLLLTARRIARDLEDTSVVLDSSLQLSAIYAVTERVEAALEVLGEAEIVAERVGNRGVLAQILSRKCDLTLISGEHKEALATCRSNAEIAAAAGAMFEVYSRFQLAIAEARAGNLGQATELCSDSTGLKENVPILHIAFMACKAEIAGLGGKAGEAREICRQIFNLAEEEGVSGQLADTNYCAELLGS